jgi:predicted dehydrogenase
VSAIAVRPAPVSDGRLGWGILGPGAIADAFVKDLKLHGHRVAAVGSRSLERAQGFATRFDIPHAHGSYDALVADPTVDVVYIATPHNLHAENAIASVQSGKHALVEKAFTLNAEQAERVVELARREQRVLVEAMWTRFLPHMAFVRSVVASGRIGHVRSLHADHCQNLPSRAGNRIKDHRQGCGAMLYIGF